MGPYQDVRALLTKPFVGDLLNEAFQNGDETTQETCNWAKGAIQAITGM